MENLENLYTPDDILLMQNADKSIQAGADRVQEIINFAKHSGINKVGIANCISMNKQTEALSEILKTNGLEVHTVACRYQKIPLSQMIGQDAKGSACNPSGQAEYLAQNQTQLNISLGLCVGHDMVFNMKSKAPVTTLIVKDRKHKNNAWAIFDNL